MTRKGKNNKGKGHGRKRTRKEKDTEGKGHGRERTML